MAPSAKTPRGALPLRHLALLLALSLLLFLPPPRGLSVPGYRAILVALAAIVLWTSEILPAGVTALFSIILLALTGAAATLPKALYGFSQPVVFFLIGVVSFGIAVEKVGLAERFAGFCLRRAGGGIRPLFWQLILSFPLLTFLLPSATTRTGILIHIYDRVLALSTLNRGAPIARSIMMALGSLNRLASTAILTGGMTPMVSSALIGGIGWSRWLVLLGIPYYLTLTVGSASIYFWYLRRAEGRLHIPEEARPPVSSGEYRTAVIVLSASALWLTDALHHLHPMIIALTGWTLLLTPGIGVLDWKEFQTRFEWANFVLIACSLTIGNTLVETGAAKWLAESLLGAAPAIASRPYFLLAAILLASVPIRILVPNLAGFLAIMIPISMEIAQSGGLNPVAVGLGVMIMGDSVLFYPAQSVPSLMAYDRGHLTAGEIFRFGLFMTAVAFASMMTFNLLWWRLAGLNWLAG